MVLVCSLLFSIVLIYGIGLERVLLFAHRPFDWRYYAKNFCLVLAVSSAGYFLQKYVFFNLLFFMPFVLAAIFFASEFLLSKIIPQTSIGKQEKNITFGLSLFALFEAPSFLDLLTVIAVGFISLMVCTCFLNSYNRITAQRNTNYYQRLASLSLIMLGLMMLIITSANAYFLNFLF